MKHRLLFWGLFGMIAIGAALLLDDTVARLIAYDHPSAMRTFARRISHYGEGWVIALVGCAGAITLALRGRALQARLWLLATGTGLLTGLAATILRSFVGRTRPIATAPQGFHGVWHDSHWIIGHYAFSSFPSGHAATVVGLAAAIWFLNRRAGLIAGLYAALICWARIASYSHHFSDVVAAAVLGVFGAWWIMKRVAPRLNVPGGRWRALDTEKLPTR